MRSLSLTAICAQLFLVTAMLGCSSPPRYDAVPMDSLAQTVNALKDNLNAYASWAPVTSRTKESEGICQGKSDEPNDMVVVTAGVELNGFRQTTIQGDLKLPTFGPLSTPSFGLSRTLRQDQKFTFPVDVVPPKAPVIRHVPSAAEQDQFQLAASIWLLREQLLQIKHTPPCLSYAKKVKHKRQDESGKEVEVEGYEITVMPLVLGFTVATTKSGAVSIIPTELPISVGASTQNARSGGQAVTLGIVITGGPAASTTLNVGKLLGMGPDDLRKGPFLIRGEGPKFVPKEGWDMLLDPMQK